MQAIQPEIPVNSEPLMDRQPPSRRGRTVRRALLVLLVVVAIPTGWSYGRAMAKPSTDALSVRSVEWLRDHGGSGLVASTERFWYTHHAPPKGGVPSVKTLPIFPPGSIGMSPLPIHHTCAAPTPARLLVSSPIPGEGQWQPGTRTVDGSAPLYTTFMRPDNVHTSLVTGVAWLDTACVKLELWSGNSEPGGSGWTLQAPIAPAVRPQLIAAFNSGFKLSDSRGGYYAEGRMVRPLVDGKASMVFHRDGRLTVAQWGRDATLTPDVVAVRQNLLLLVDGGMIEPGLDQDSLARWGFTPGNKTLVWRSGVGIDGAGHIIYAAGNGLSVSSLANVLAAAGAVRAMELDINSTWTHFYSFHDDPTVPGGASGTKLVPDMLGAADKYFHPSSRDFVAVFARRKALPPEQ
jgi:hypothetical protein